LIYSSTGGWIVQDQLISSLDRESKSAKQYSWDSKEWNTLWEDLMELHEEESKRNHFIGSIVTMPTQSIPEGVAKYLLIDGQQRFTTLDPDEYY